MTQQEILRQNAIIMKLLLKGVHTIEATRVAVMGATKVEGTNPSPHVQGSNKGRGKQPMDRKSLLFCKRWVGRWTSTSKSTYTSPSVYSMFCAQYFLMQLCHLFGLLSFILHNVRQKTSTIINEISDRLAYLISNNRQTCHSLRNMFTIVPVILYIF